MIFSTVGRRFSLNRPQRLFQQVRTGYIVLLPEIDPEQFDQNPLFNKNGLPDIENITQGKCMRTLGKYLLDFEGCVRRIETDITEKSNELELFDDIVNPLEDFGTKFETTWGLVKTIYLVDNKKMPSETYLSLHERAKKARCKKFNSKEIYHFFKNYDSSKFTEEEQRVVSKFLTEGKLNGLELDGSKRDEFEGVCGSLSKKVVDFSQRVRICSRKFSHFIRDPSLVKDFPEDLLRSISMRNDPNRGPWRITLPVMDRYLQYCPDRDERWNIWKASRQLASNQHASELNNSAHLEDIRALRRNLAKVLGYTSFVHMSMETKMAGSVENIQNTLTQLLEAAKPHQENELNSLQAFAEERGFEYRLELWDIPYWERLQKISMYQWDDQKMKEFFPYEKVLNGLFNVISNYFNIRIEEASGVTTWHEDCKLYNVYDEDEEKPVAMIYIDPYKRSTKLSSEIGQVINIKPVARAMGSSIPVAAVILDLPAPDETPSLLTLGDVSTLFAKLGEALQQVLCSVNYSEVSGLNNVEWDAVHIVSNFMPLLLTEPEVVQEISSHYKSNETIPITDLAPIIGHMPGLNLCNEIYLANLDLNLHIKDKYWYVLVKEMWPQHFCFDLHKCDYHPLSYTRSISQGMACAVYSELWSKILAVDAFNAFKTDANKANVGARFRDTFLAFGGSCHSSEVFRRFQGRDPTTEAFLTTTFPNSL